MLDVQLLRQQCSPKDERNLAHWIGPLENTYFEGGALDLTRYVQLELGSDPYGHRHLPSFCVRVVAVRKAQSDSRYLLAGVVLDLISLN